MNSEEKKIIMSIGKKLHKSNKKLPSDTLKLLNFIEEKIDILLKHDSTKTRVVYSQNRRITEILNVLMSFSNLDFKKRASITKENDIIDGLAVGINMMGEELSASTVSLKEKETLLKEVHHRVKNNLQLVQSLLSIQSSYITDKYSNEKFQESIERVRSMALIHEKLYINPDLSKIDFSDYLDSLVNHLFVSYNINPDRIKVVFDIEKTFRFMDINQAIPCGLIVNELLTNSFKYAFPKNKKGEIKLMYTSEKSGKGKFKNLISVSDNGIGLPKDFDQKASLSLGMQLVTTLVEQIDGKLTIGKNQGAEFRVSFITEEEM